MRSQLPGSIRQLWGSLPPGGALPLALAVVQETVTPLERPLVGGVRIDLDVARTSATLMKPTPPAAGSGRWAARPIAGQGAVLTAETAVDVLWELALDDVRPNSRDEEPK